MHGSRGKERGRTWSCGLVLAWLCAPLAGGQDAPAAGARRDAAALAADLGLDYDVWSDVTYRRVGGQDLKLDLYLPRGLQRPNATLVSFHGGGWVAGSKGDSVLHLLPYFELGLSVVNVQYRLAASAPAPAAVEDGRCALRYLLQKAGERRLDPRRLVLTGASAGGHLALATGLLPASAGFDRSCPGLDSERWDAAPVESDPRVAAIVNWFGITDVSDLVEGPHARGYAIEWLGSRADRLDLARRLSPLHHVRPGLPPVLTIHGDQDRIVPYDHARRLHVSLDKAGVPNRLLTVAGAGHGDFSREQRRQLFGAVREFLEQHGVLGPAR